jgi:flagellar basal body P-ring formation protein FlgA
MRRLLVLAALAASFASAAIAGQPVVLRADVSDADGRVTLADLFEGAGGAGRILVATTRPGASVVLDAATVQRIAMANGLSWQNAQGLRRIIVRPAGGAGGIERAEVLTYTRSLKTGEVVGPNDLAWAKAVVAPIDAPKDADALIGMAARRPLRAGATAALRDVTAPEVIRKDETVQVSYRAGKVNLTLQAKALKGAAAGETVDLVNPASKKIIQAIATGPGQAVVGPDALAAKTAASNQYAFLR